QEMPPLEQKSPAPEQKPTVGETIAPIDAQINDNPTGRQEPAVSLEWIGPPTAKMGQPIAYQIMVKNVSASAVQMVNVVARFPSGVTVSNVQPAGINEGNTCRWDVGTLEPRQEKRLDVQLQPVTRGELSCQASVTFTGTSTARLTVREPQLAI